MADLRRLPRSRPRRLPDRPGTQPPRRPSVKYHLPRPGETTWRTEEYHVTTRAILDAYQSAGGALPMPLEKDFSPTLAGSDRAAARASVLDWIRRVPDLIRAAAPGPGQLRVGLKLFNSLDDDDFQLQLLAEVFKAPDPPDFLVYANRLFDPDRDSTASAASPTAAPT